MEAINIISNKEYKSILSMIGVTYLGNIKQSAKMMYSYNNGTITFCLYLAPWNLSGYQICPKGQHCNELCLNGAGRNKGDIIAHGQLSNINVSRIKKTRFFFEHRELFMQCLVREIVMAQKYAESKNMEFSVRLNGTSDISPLAFKFENGLNILDIFPNVQFYDYTKVIQRYNIYNRYKNYDLTFSFDGYNWNECEWVLNNGGRIAVVFENELPTLYKGYNIIDTNGYDMRYKDSVGIICGLHFHRTANNYKNGKYIRPINNPFVVLEDDINCKYEFPID